MKALVALALALVALPALADPPQPFVRGSWAALRAQHKNRPTVIHLWGLTCGPCLVELPKWGRFLHEQPGADVVMIAADPIVEDPAQIAAMLAKAGLADVESWSFADPFTDRLQYEIDRQWHGELPVTVLVGRDGTARTQIGAADFSEIRRWIGAQAAREAHPR